VQNGVNLLATYFVPNTHLIRQSKCSRNTPVRFAPSQGDTVKTGFPDTPVNRTRPEGAYRLLDKRERLYAITPHYSTIDGTPINYLRRYDAHHK